MSDSFAQIALFLFGLACIALIDGCWTWFGGRQIRYLRSALAAQRKATDNIRAEADAARREALTARIKAETASAAKSDFLANTSHEIRTPMNAILGMTRLLLDSPLSTEQQSWAEIVHDSGENLLAIINDILDLSKIEAGRLTLASDSFDLYRAIAEITDLLILRAEQKNVALIVDIAADAPRFMTGDVVRVKQIIMNFLSNAKKFTPAGHVKLSLRKDASRDHVVHIDVEDTGIGIPEDKLSVIFEKFTQAEGSTMRRFGGTGLGLAITQRLVTMMGGTISVESTVNKGSCFSLSVPFSPAAPAPSEIPAVALAGKRILILADHPLKRSIAESYARRCGLIAESCVDASDVTQLLRDAENRGELVDYLLIDHSLGGAKLLELIERILIFPSFQTMAFLAVAMLGSATATRILNSHQVAALLSRPLFPDQLEDALKIIEHARQSGIKTGLVTRNRIEKARSDDHDKPAATPVFRGATVLIVEDMEVNQILMAKILEKLGCNAEAAMSGQEAIDKLRNKPYDLIFMDGHMPEMDGFEATRRIRLMEKDSGHSSIIVALTADAMSGDAEKYIAAGMNDYLTKPVTPERIAAMLGKWVVRG